MSDHRTTYTREELLDLGIAQVGDDVHVDSTVRFYGASRVQIGSHVRIDAYCVLSAGSLGLTIGNYIHLAAGVRVLGGDEVTFEDFSGVSAGVCIFGGSEDYTGGALTNPTVPDAYRKVKVGPVRIRRHAIIGANSVIMPRVTLGVAASVGALTFVRKSVPDFAIVSGNPMRRVGERNRRILELEQQFLSSVGESPGSQDSR